MAKYILFDTETTGNQKEDRIIQVGAMIVDTNGEVEVFNELCSTVLPIKKEAMAIHGITPDLIEGKTVFAETNFYKTLQSLNNQENFLIAHNMPFDMGMMEKEGFISQIRIIDTLRVAKHLLPEQKSKALQYLRYALELYKEEQAEADKYNITIKAHDAIGDVLVMKLLLSKLVSLTKEKFPDANPMEKMEELTKTPILIETFTFGKHKGKKISDIYDSDRGYIDWMQKNMDLDVDMKYTLDTIMRRYNDMAETYFYLKYGRRIDAAINNKNTSKISINKNYIIDELDKENLDYESCIKAFNDKYPNYKEYYDLYYNESRASFFANPDDLLKWFKNQKNRCGYCGVTQKDLKKLAVIRGTSNKPNITLNGKTKRSKGTLEIEKKDPAKGYTYENCILACPLCNNAKSNLIDEDGWRDKFVSSMQNYYESLLGYKIK